MKDHSRPKYQHNVELQVVQLTHTSAQNCPPPSGTLTHPPPSALAIAESLENSIGGGSACRI